MPVGLMPILRWCVPCLARGRRTEATIKVSNEWFCNGCRSGFDGHRDTCKNCQAGLRPGNRSGYCFECRRAGAIEDDKENVRRSVSVGA